MSFDLPAHGERVDRFGEGITGWRNAFVAGVDPFAQLVEEGRAVLDECVRRGWARPGRIAVGGTSRGGYMALRLLAADDRIAAGAGFAPVTDWRCLAEFAADRERDDLARLRLDQVAEKMAGRHVYLSIGSTDERVSTAACRDLQKRLVQAQLHAGFDASCARFLLTEDQGHTMGTAGYEQGAAFLLKWSTAR